MLGIHKHYRATFTVQQTAHVLSISRQTYLMALEQYPGKAAAEELQRSEAEAAEQLWEAVRKTAARKLMWRQYQWMLRPDEPVPTHTELMDRMFRYWSNWVHDVKLAKHKREGERLHYEEMIDTWKQKHLQVQELLQHRREMDEVLAQNLSRWGKPAFPKHRSHNVRYWLGWSALENTSALSTQLSNAAYDDRGVSRVALSARGGRGAGSSPRSAHPGGSGASTPTASSPPGSLTINSSPPSSCRTHSVRGSPRTGSAAGRGRTDLSSRAR